MLSPWFAWAIHVHRLWSSVVHALVRPTQIPPGNLAEIADRLGRIVTDLYRKGIRYYGAGGTLSFDYEKVNVMWSSHLKTVETGKCLGKILT